MADGYARTYPSYDGLVARYEDGKKRLDAVKAECRARSAKRESIARFFADINKQDGLLTGFDEDLWYATVDTMAVRSEREVTVTFKDGSEISVKI